MVLPCWMSRSTSYNLAGTLVMCDRMTKQLAGGIASADADALYDTVMSCHTSIWRYTYVSPHNVAFSSHSLTHRVYYRALLLFPASIISLSRLATRRSSS